MRILKPDSTPHRFLGDESGNVTVEFCMWLPLVLVMMLIIFDGALALIAQANLWHIAGEISRALALGRVAEDDIHQAFNLHSSVAIMVTPHGDFFHLTVSRPMAQIGTGFFLSQMGDLSVGLAQMSELQPALDE